MTDQKDPDDQVFEGPTLGSDGRLEGRFNNVETRAPVEELLELELEQPAPKPHAPPVESYRDEVQPPAKKPWAVQLVIAALVVGGIALGALLFFKQKLDLQAPDGVRASTLLDELSTGEVQPIIVSSTPTGATISIGGAVVGQTPWAGENRWAGETAVTITLRGYRPWEGKLRGGTPQTLDIKLEK